MANMDYPSFFKVLVHDSKSILRIPPLFVKTFEQILPQHALIKTKSRETWSVKIERIGEHYCFTDGWPKFVNDFELERGDFLVFWLMTGEKSIFKVAIYGVTGCLKELNSATASHRPIKVEPEDIDELDLKTACTLQPNPSNTTCGGKSKKPTEIENRGHGAQISFDSVEDPFTKVLAKHHQAEVTGLIGKKKVMLQYQNGRSTTVEVLKTSRTRQTLRSNCTTHSSKRGRPKKIANRSQEDGRFTKVLNKYTRTRMLVPIPFAKKTGLIRKTKVRLHYLKGWSTTVALKFNRKCPRLDICGSGWPEFRIKNNLLEGNAYAFQFIHETDSIQVQEVDCKP